MLQIIISFFVGARCVRTMVSGKSCSVVAAVVVAIDKEKKCCSRPFLFFPRVSFAGNSRESRFEKKKPIWALGDGWMDGHISG